MPLYVISDRISNDINPKRENFEYGYPHSNALLQLCLKLKHCKPHNVALLPTKCDVIIDVKLFSTVYRRIYCRKFLRFSIRSRFTKARILCIRNNDRCFFLRNLCSLEVIIPRK